VYNKILVPIDGSDTARQGLAEAVKIAAAMGSRLRLVHIVNEFVFDYTYSPALYATDLIDSMRARGQAVLAEAVSKVTAHGLRPESTCLETIGGSAADLIVQEAKNSKADLIVMGTHGRRGLRRLALGSDAEEVVRAASVPVLLVRSMPQAQTRATAESRRAAEARATA